MLVSSLPNLPKETFSHACSSLNIGGTTVVVVAGYRTSYILPPFDKHYRSIISPTEVGKLLNVPLDNLL